MLNWYEMPETTEKERAEKEIAECNYCINGLINSMRKMRIPQKDWGKNAMIQTYLKRIEKAKLVIN
jgi:hypothetical protein